MTGTIGSKGLLRANTKLFRDMFNVLDGLEYRRATTEKDFRAIGDLRQRAFDSRDIYEHKFGDAVIDDLDLDPSTFVFGLYYEGDLVSTVRIIHLTAENRNAPVQGLFGEVLNPLLDQGMTFIDPSRLAVEDAFSKDIPNLPLLTLRLPVIATIFFNANYCLSAVKKEHRAFYLRVFRSTLLAGPFNPPGMKVEAVLLGAALQNREDIFSRYPIFNFEEAESQALFGASSLPRVRPTARHALKAA